MRNFIEFVLVHLVQHPEDVEVIEHEEEGITFYDIKVNAEDRGQVIGRHGRTIESLRNLVKVRAMKENKRVRVQVLDDEIVEDMESPDTEVEVETETPSEQE
jgi:predicted RNA-binding protein YlqC (UPF0109 family)